MYQCIGRCINYLGRQSCVDRQPLELDCEEVSYHVRNYGVVGIF